MTPLLHPCLTLVNVDETQRYNYKKEASQKAPELVQ